MPSAMIEVRRDWGVDGEAAMIEAVLAAMREALRLPAHDRNVRLVVHAPHRFAAPGGLADPDRFTMVTIDMFAGRSIDAKRALYRGLVERLAACGVPADHVTICLRAIPREDWGVRGGQAACDVDLGFEVTV